MKVERRKTDVLCVGGGVAGLMAAVGARKEGAEVIVVEKGNAAHSGAGRIGCDHFGGYFPDVHGPDMEDHIDYMLNAPMAGMHAVLSREAIRANFSRTMEVVNMWESWGIPMKYRGKYVAGGHGIPGMKLISVHYQGRGQKPILHKKALEAGAEIMNRMMIFELLGGPSGITGAIGIDTREDRLIEFQTKTVLLGTGLAMRVYPNITPGLLGNELHPPTCTGDGLSMAYRLGAELVSAEKTMHWVGLKNFARPGKGTWVGVYKDKKGNVVGPFVTTPQLHYGDSTPDMDPLLFYRMRKDGEGPVYLDGNGMTDEDIEYLRFWLNHEGNATVLNHMDDENIDHRNSPLEFITYGLTPGAKMSVNERAETTIKGMYAAGDELSVGIGWAATFGYLAGESAAKYAKTALMPDIEKEKDILEQKQLMIEEIQVRQEGFDWRDANIALQNTMQDYCGMVRWQEMLEAGLNHLRRLRSKVGTKIRASNRWELTRCLEVLNMFDLGELILQANLEIKDRRGLHPRIDCNITDPRIGKKSLFVRKVDGNPEFEWRTIKHSR
jgi:succinate dehydrogenase/fumarate reductase flavoprotein subunit